MDPYTSVRHRYDFHLHGRHQPAAGCQRQIPNLVDRFTFHRFVDRYFSHVAEGICLSDFFLVAHTRRWYFCRGIWLCVT